MTGKVMPVGMNYLSDLVIRPGIEKVFGPLLLYRGNMNRGHAHRLWNFALLMMAAECETLPDGFRILVLVPIAPKGTTGACKWGHRGW